MRFSDYLSPSLVQLDPRWSTFAETVRGLVSSMAAAGRLAAAAEDEAVEAVLKREATASTALPEIQASVPHARLASLREPIAALAASTRGIYMAAPLVPIRIVALVLSPPNASEEHLHLLAAISTLLRSARLREELLAAADPAAALAVLRRYERGAV